MSRLTLLVLLVPAVFAQNGAVIYQTRCAACHDAPAGRVPSVSALHAMSEASILTALDNGSMKPQAAGLTESERRAVATYLGRPDTAAGKTVANGCTSEPGAVEKSSGAWMSWGADSANTRFQNAEAGGVTARQLPQLRLKWAFNLGAISPHSQPAVAFGTVFIGSGDSKLYALDAGSGCTRWVFDAGAPIRSGIAVGETSGAADEGIVLFGARADVYAVSAGTGKLIWKEHIDDHPAATITATPAFHKGVVYAAVSSFEEALAASPKYACCTFRGSVVALNAGTGAQIWKTYTIPDSKGGGKRASGAAVWSTPTFDEKLNAIYVATGDNYSDPRSETSDAVLALDEGTGKLLWLQQATAGDAYNMACGLGVHGNCPPNHGGDFDFGQPPILLALADGHRALVIAQKSGVVYAFDPDNGGKQLWSRRAGQGGALGGSEWGSAAEGGRAYVAISDIQIKGVLDPKSALGFRFEPDTTHGGGLFALDAATGKIVWAAKPPNCGERKPCSPAQSAPVTAIPGAVLSGAYDGHLRAYSADTGDVLWDVDTAHEYQAVNGGKANGGALDVTGPVIANGMMYVTSGYGQWGGMPGNVLLAYGIGER